MNKVILVGRLTKDPVLKGGDGGGSSIVNFTLAVDRNYKKEGQPNADFINCIAFGKRAEILSQYLSKGSLLSVSGRIQTGSFDAKDGGKRYTTDVLIEEFKFLSNTNSKDGTSPQNGNNPVDPHKDMVPVDDGDIPF